MNLDQWIHFEDREIYDGWIVKFHPLKDKIEWRTDHYAYSRVTPEKKHEIEQLLKEHMKEMRDEKV